MSNPFIEMEKKLQEKKPIATNEPTVPPIVEQSTVEPKVEKPEVVAEVKTDAVEVKKEEDKPKEKKIIKTILGTKEMQEDEVVETNEFTDTNKFVESVNKKLGTKAKDLTDVFGFFEKVIESDNIKKEKDEIELTKNSYEQLINSMPQDVLKIMDDVVNGRDYKSTIKSLSNSEIDYTKSINSYGKDELINLYNKIDNEEYEEMSDVQKERLYNNAKRLFEKEQNDFKVSTDNFTQKQKNIAKSFLSSIDESKESMLKQYPDIDKKELAQLESIMKSGINNILFNENGTYKKNAAEVIMLGTHGKKIIEQITEQYEKELKRKIKQAQSEKAEEIISSTPGGDTIKKATFTPNEMSLKKEVQEKGMPFLKILK
jgi:hypothetical protein